MKTTNRSGFTIIEVVITIAIGAAVMALVLNAVAGARRSQRNNARAADVNTVAAGVNQYIATRNQLPEHFGEISGIVDTNKFGHYDVSSINSLASWAASVPSGSTTAGVCTWSTGTPPAITPTTSATCIASMSTVTPVAGAWITNIGVFAWNNAYTTGPATSVNMHPTTGKSDYLMVINEAGCTGSAGAVVKGGIREVAIVYSLEGQTDLICLEI